MRKYLLFLVIISLFSVASFAQDFSNKGSEFYLCFPNHVPNSNAAVNLSIYITSDAASTGNITMANGAFTSTYNLNAANNFFQEIQISSATAEILSTQSNAVIQKSIKVKKNVGQADVVVYAHQFAGARSAATLVLPKAVLGKKYYAFSFSQNGTDFGATHLGRSQFQVIAVEPNTVVQVTPKWNGVLQTPFNITLPNAGDIYQYQPTGATAPTVDITGTYIESLPSGTGGCLPIAVFSGSSALYMNTSICSSGQNSYDPLWQQMYPISSWGKNFGFIPFETYTAGNPYRIMAAENNTNVSINGIQVATLNAGDIYPNSYTLTPVLLNTPSRISADKSICVAQYAQKANCSGNVGNIGDPDMVILNPIEQNIDDITVFSTGQLAISSRYVNVLLKTIDVPNFRISKNGLPLLPPVSAWQNFAQLPGYSYLKESLNGISTARLVSDSGFNAIAYGFGNFESYAYSAGTNIKDLYTSYGTQSQFAIESGAVCTNSPFRFKMSLPFRPDSIYWDLSVIPNTPQYGLIKSLAVFPATQTAYDSVTVVNNKNVYWYSINSFFAFTNVGVYNIPITLFSANSDGCGSVQTRDFPLDVSAPPIANFTFSQPGCPLDPVTFTDATISTKPNYQWTWNFGDPASGLLNTSTLENPVHLFVGPSTNANPRDFTVSMSTITTAGCFGSVQPKIVTIPNLPTATISGATTLCINATPTNITFTGNFGLPPYVFSYHINSGPIQTITSTSTTALLPINTTVAGTFTYYLDSIKNQGSTICNQPQTGNVVVNITPDATLTLSSAAATAGQTICINNAITNITYAVGGSGTGGSVSGLPAGVTGTYLGGVITISGTPTISGTFNYTVSTTGPCVKPQLTGTLNVTTDATLALSTPVPTASQTVCINTPLTNITYTIGGSGTGGSVSGLPIGVTGTYTGGVITISGTPTVSGIFNYTVSTTGPCVKPSLIGVINVNANATLALLSAVGTNNQNLCINVPITNITYAVGASGIGGSVSGLPAGVTGNYAAGVITISGTPTVSGIFNYTVSTTGPCVKPQATGTITVIANATIVLSSPIATSSQTICINTPLTNITYAVGGSGTGGSVSGLPTGVTGTYAAGVVTITGTPTVSGVYNYTVSTTGPCVMPTITGVINVTANATLALSSAAGTNNQNLCINVPITNITYAVGASGTGGSVSGLPTGVTGTYTSGVITISGAPTVIGTFNYTVSTTGPCVKPTATGSITVTPDATITLTSAVASTNQQLCKNKPLTNITYQIAAGGTGGTVIGLPAGVIGTYAGGIFTISGTPTVDGLFNYTVTTTGTCVQKTATGSILVHPLPTASFTTTAPYCALKDLTFTPSSSISSGSITSWVWNYDNGTGQQIRTDNNPFTINYATAGIKNVTFKTVSDRGCESILFATPVTINVKPKAGFLSPESCLADAFAQFTDSSKPAGTIALWEWNFGDPLSPTNIISGSGPTFQNPQHAYLTTGLKTVSLIVTTTSGCKDTVPAQSFFINGEVTSADFITLTSPICSNRQVQIRENSVVNVGGLIRVEIYWDNVGAPTVIQTDELPTPGKIYTHVYPNLQVDRTYQVRYIAYTGFDGTCQKEVIKPITVRASPVAVFTTPQDVCLNGGPVVLNTGTASGGTGVYSGFGVTFAGGVYTFDPLAPNVTVGANNVVYQVTSPANCDSTIPRLIKVLAPPVVNTFTTVGNKCRINNITFRNTTTNGDGTIVRWIYDWGDGSLPQVMTTGADVTHQYATAGIKTATLTLETGYGCKNIPFPLTFTVNPLPVPSYTTSPSACLPSANVVFTNTTAAPLSNYTFNWSFELPSTSAANISTAPNPSHIYTTQGPHNTHLIATINATGCKDSTLVIPIGSSIIHPQPVLQFNTIPDVCLNNGNQSFLNLVSEISGIPGGPRVFSGPGIISANGDFNPLLAGAGMHTITCTWASAFGCPDTITRQVKVLAAPVVNVFTTIGNLCETNDIIFHNETTQGAGTITTWVYDWNDGNTQTVNNGNDITHVYALAGTYNPTLYVITNDGCRSLVKPLGVVVNALPKPDFNFTPVACLPQAKVDFTNITPPQSTGGLAYQWLFDDVPPTIKTTVNADFTYTSLGSHPVELIATNTTTFCKGSKVKDIMNSLHPAPTASFNFNKPSVCIRDNVTVLDGPSNPADGTMTNWEWNYGDNGALFTGQIQAPYTYGAAGTYPVKLKVTNSFGCVHDTTKSFTVHPYPVVNAGRDSIILEGGQIVLTPIVTGNDLRYLWTGNPAPLRLSNDTVKNPIASPIADITYRLKVTSRGGCSDTNSVFIKVLKFPLIPNTFTPNNDGVHDTWVIQYLDSYPDARVQVFTRTGQLVFESRRYTRPWDGTMNGKSLPFDTYYYIIEPGTGRVPLTGYVTIVK